MALKSVNPLLTLQQRAVGAGVSNGFKMDALVPEHSQIYVDITDVGAAGVLDVKIEDSWKDEAGKYTKTGDEALALGSAEVVRIPPDNVRGKYMRVSYTVSGNPVTFAVYLVKKERS